MVKLCWFSLTKRKDADYEEIFINVTGSNTPV